jgi:hypothetical protein
MYKTWHPDVCRDQRAHEMTIKIGEAKEFLLDEEKRKQYDNFRAAYISGKTGSTHADRWKFEQEWNRQASQVRSEVQRAASLTLEDVLTGVIALAAVGAAVAVGAAAAGTAYVWQGSDRFAGRENSFSFWQRFWCGIGGWACVICLLAPGTSIITFYCFYWAFFPGPEKKFVGCGTVLSSMCLAGVVVVPVLIFLIMAIVSAYR